MEFRCGNKRMVILTKKYAIKIAKFRFIRCLSRFIVLPFSKKLRVRFLNKYGPSFGEAFMNDLCAGIRSNKNEHSFSKMNAQSNVMPIMASWCNGIVIIQVRGLEVSEEELHHMIPDYENEVYKHANLDRPEQWCWHKDGSLRVCDYGELSTAALLLSGLKNHRNDRPT